jgi:hypothetical protein
MELWSLLKMKMHQIFKIPDAFTCYNAFNN